jgi:ABC-2 type transport system permease protein
MLRHKAWRESRTRFLLSLLTLSALCVAFVFFEGYRGAIDGKPVTYLEYIWRLVYKGYLRELFDLIVLLMGVGGLLRERDHGTSGFTLALPVSRLRHVCARAGVGVMEVVVLAFVPALIVPTLSPLVGQVYPWFQAAQFGLLWAVGGSFLFAIGFFCSVLFAGEFTAPIAAILLLLLYSVITDFAWVERYLISVHDLMSGSESAFFQTTAAVMVGPLPWTALAVISLVVLSSFVWAGRITMRQDF